MNLQDDDELTVLAGEYVLGTLAGTQREAFERAMARDARVRREVYAWQDRLQSLNLVPAPADAPASLWARIERGLPALAGAAAGPGFWARVSVWRWASGAALAASVLLATLLVLRPGPTLERHYVAVLQDPQQAGAGWVVDASNPRELRLIPLVDRAVPANNAMEVWTKADGAARPTSLGLLQGNSVTVIPIERLPTLEGNQLFEITLEPRTGSPTGGPTGPILFIGRTVAMEAKKTL